MTKTNSVAQVAFARVSRMTRKRNTSETWCFCGQTAVTPQKPHLFIFQMGRKPCMLSVKSVTLMWLSCRVMSPPTSPPPEPPVRTEASKRPLTRKERPVSCGILPNIYSSVAKYDTTSPNNDLVHAKEKRSSLMVSPTPNEVSPKYKSTPQAKPQARRNDLEPKCLFREERGESLHPPVQGFAPKSPLEDHKSSRENLSATSGSLSSLSPPSSPSKLKSEQEKQEQESNEKSLIGKRKRLHRTSVLNDFRKIKPCSISNEFFAIFSPNLRFCFANISVCYIFQFGSYELFISSIANRRLS